MIAPVFDSLTSRLSATLRGLAGKARLTEDKIAAAQGELRAALLEADVALSVVASFTERVKARALGKEVSAGLSAGQAFIRIVSDELTAVMAGDAEAGKDKEAGALNLRVQPPAVILLCGLQGAGKTSSAAKLGHFLRTRQKKHVLLASTDVHRPAAIEQLATLASQAGLDFFECSPKDKPAAIAAGALAAARKRLADVLLVDTAGRSQLDEAMMAELAEVHKALAPVETLFIVDALIGQDAAETARAFGERLPLTGLLLTKADGDSRGGAALSARMVTGKPIKFMAQGEAVDAYDVFYPDRIASRILGMGDALSLIEEAERKLDQKKASRFAKKVKKGQRFDLDDFRQQLQQIGQMGGMASMLEKLPGMAVAPQQLAEKMSDGHLAQMGVIIDSMTPGERRYPDVINPSRKQRIAAGSGTQLQDVNRLLKQHKQMQKGMKKLGRKGGMAKMVRGLKALPQ